MTKKPDRSSSVPLYAQLETYFRLRIVEGELSPGDRLPPETELAKTFGVSRMTLRQALDNLVRDGLLMRQRGKGTFVAEPPRKITAPLYFPVSFTEQMANLGYAASSRLLKSEVIENPPALVAEHLNLPADQPVIHIRRLRLANQLPVSLDSSYLPYHLCPEIMEADLAGSLFSALQRLYDLRPVKGENWLEPAIATPTEAELLNVAPGTPLLLMYGVSRLEDGTPIEYSKALWRGDRVRFVFRSHDGSLSLQA
ncbi:MAG TPA: GntR family transcriptional regulator [Chloroflexi bacterium]|nr:GntR family transcriptional regulator [Chloroflexota bacterium]